MLLHYRKSSFSSTFLFLPRYLHLPQNPNQSTMVFLLLFLIIPLSLLTVKLTYTLLYIPLKTQRHFRRQGVTGPPYRPPFGNTVDIRSLYAASQSKPLVHPHGHGLLSHDIVPRVNPHYAHWSAHYGNKNFFLYWFGPRPMLAVAQPELVREILMNANGAFGRIPPNPQSKLLFGDGLPFLEGEKWGVHRRIANHAFSIDKIKAWIPDMVSSTVKMMEKWEEEEGIKAASSSTGFEVDVSSAMQKLSADIISRTAFGSSYEQGEKIFELQDQQVRLFSLAVRSVYIPGFRFLPTNRNRERRRIEAETRRLIRSLIAKTQDETTAATGDGKKKNLISLLLSATSIDEDGAEKKLSIEEVIDECKTFYFAGKETTAHLLTWALLLLASNPDWQRRAREEIIRNGFGRNGKPNSTDDTLSELKIVNAILNETLRLYPPAVMLKRRANRTVSLGRSNLILPAGTQLYLAMAAVHHDVEIWGDDAHEFNPARFLDDRKNNNNNNRPTAAGSFFPFSIGPRFCVGQGFAVAESKVVLGMIVRRYEFEVSASYVHAPMHLATLQPQYGVQIVFRRISDT